MSSAGDGLDGGALDESVADVFVVGAGAAGAVVAARASEDPNRTVVVVEAGPDHPLLAELPGDLVDGHDNSYTDHDWGLDFLPIADRGRQAFPRGRVTGGSTAVNTTIALRGIPEDYDGWADRGCPDWSWERVLPAFRRLERDLDFGAAPHHGDAGPISIRRFPDDELVPTQAAFLEAARSLGHPECVDANDPDDWGVSRLPMNKLGRVRISTAVGYLAPARVRPNLRIVADTLTRRVVVEGGRATGVEVEGPTGEVRVIRARLVVLCCGAIHTPGVLVRSGIGRRSELDHLGIDPVAVLDGVGANLADHPALAVVCEAREPAWCAPDLPLIQTITRYTSPGSDARLDVNIELISRARLRRDGPPAFVIAPSLEWVEGRGEVRQTSADPRSMPAIEPDFGTCDVDVRRHVAAWKDALELARRPPLADMIERVVFPDPSRVGDDDLTGLARRVTGSGYHPCGTARMGPADDPTTVVDQHGRCHAVDGLVVADASIMPTVPRANINLSTIVIGETIGEWLRTDPTRYGL
ncbi:MAG: GMC family oxidoreductase [Actinomycetota bacterium]|nr:GMC family oxidoreductase [Actinomycetota bacterium]